MVDTTLVSTDILSRITTSAQKRYVKEKLPKVGWGSLRFLELVEGMKETTTISGEDGAISDAMQLVPELATQNIRGADTIIDPQAVNDALRFETGYTHTVLPIKFQHDEWRQRGWEFTPHASGDYRSRVKKLGEEKLQKLANDLFEYTMDGVNQRFSEMLELDLLRQGSSYKDPVGINGQFPLAPVGTIYGHNRLNQPLVRHDVQGSTIGTNGTLLANLRKQRMRLMEATARCGMPGEWIPVAGQDWIEGYASELERLSIQRQGDIGGINKADGVLRHDALLVAGLKPLWVPNIDRMDTLYPSELGIAPSSNAVTFSSGGATTQATGFAMVSAGGAVTAIVITDAGAGYTSAPTVSVAVGSSATFQAKVYSTSSGAGFETVQADDYRLGRLASVAVTAGGSGYTPGQQISFRKRCWFLFKPALKYKIANGVDRRISMPADPARQRVSELQMDSIRYFYNRMPSAFGMSYISN